MAHPQGMYGDPAKYLEDRQNYQLSKACKPCVHHQYTEFGIRRCKLKKLEGNDLSICGEFRPKPVKDGVAELAKARLEELFKGS